VTVGKAFQGLIDSIDRASQRRSIRRDHRGRSTWRKRGSRGLLPCGPT
jgi:hypothetical protein